MAAGPQCIVEYVLSLMMLKSLQHPRGPAIKMPASQPASLSLQSPKTQQQSFFTLFASCSPWAVFKHDLIATCQAEDGCKMLPYYVGDGVNPGSLLSQQPV